jgi:hypothetical protein
MFREIRMAIDSFTFLIVEHFRCPSIIDHHQSWGYKEGPWKEPGSAGGR